MMRCGAAIVAVAVVNSTACALMAQRRGAAIAAAAASAGGPTRTPQQNARQSDLFRTSRRAVFALALAPRLARAAGPRRVLCAGATGRSGRECVRALDADARYEAVPMVRSAARWRDVSAEAGLAARTAVEADVTVPATLDLALRRIDDIVCDIGFVPTFDSEADRRAALAVDRDGVIALVEAAERAKLPGRFVLVSSLLAGEVAARDKTTSYRMLNGLGGVLDAKRVSEARLRESTLDWTILRPGVFVDAPQGGLVVGGEDRFLSTSADARGLDRVSCKSPFFASSGAACAVTRSQCAEACVAALSDAGASRRTLEVVARPDALKLDALTSVVL